jgi:metal-sulfur cluster biosynthetic enzyme
MQHDEATQAGIVDLVRATVNEIYDPCGMAIGLNIGLAEMGLVREIAANPAPAGWHVRVRLRVTSPGCQYFFYFQQELERRLLTHHDIAAVDVQWDDQLDWTPEDIAPTARAKMALRQQMLRDAHARQAAVRKVGD